MQTKDKTRNENPTGSRPAYKKMEYEKQSSRQQMRGKPKAKNNDNKTCENTLHARIFLKNKNKTFDDNDTKKRET